MLGAVYFIADAHLGVGSREQEAGRAQRAAAQIAGERLLGGRERV